MAAIDRAQPIATALVVSTTGSTPGRQGWRALIDASGGIHGTLGGGIMEATVQRTAAETLCSGRAALMRLEMDGPGSGDPEPICGGVMRILIDPNPARHRHAFEQASQSQQTRRRGRLITKFDDSPSPEIEVRWLEDGESTRSETQTDSHQACLFEELVAPPPRVVIFGAGHVGQALARQARLLDFEMAVVDDRPEFTQAALFPPGTTLVCGSPAEAVRQLRLDCDTDVVLVGRGYRQDLEALAACIGETTRSIGMIGSRRKVAVVKRDLIDAGRATPEALERIDAPVGLDIGGVTAAEIAVSVAAQWIESRRGQAGSKNIIRSA